MTSKLCKACQDIANEWNVGERTMVMNGAEYDHDCRAELYPENKIKCLCACSYYGIYS